MLKNKTLLFFIIICVGILGCIFALEGISVDNLLENKIKSETREEFKTGLKSVFQEGIHITATGYKKEREIPLYGFNGNNIRGAKWSTPGLMEKIKSIPFKAIRYPGGNISNWWDWRNAWFVKDSNLPKTYKKVPEVPMGLKELKNLVSETHIEVVFVLNLLTSSLEEQMAMLKEARRLGIPVKWVELGNEFNLSGNSGHKTFKDGAYYGAISKTWISVIKEEFPDVKIGVIGGNRPKIGLNYWNNKVLKNAVGADGIVWHAYLPAKESIIKKNTGFNFQTIYKKIYGHFNAGRYNRLRSNINIWLTEYNIQWTILGKNHKNIQEYVKTWGQALTITLMTSSITDISPNITVLTNHNLTGFPIFAAIETFPKKSFRLMPNGIGMKAWLEAADGMTTMRKINFAIENEAVPDYSLFGWEFFNDNNKSRTLLVNLEDKPVTINLNKIITSSLNYQSFYADKNKEINGDHDINKVDGVTSGGTITLPAFSINTLQ